MNKDSLEHFITNNRADFDDAVPSLKVWAAVDKSLDATKQKRSKRLNWWRMTKVAAAGLLLIVAASIGGYQFGRTEVPPPLASEVVQDFQDMSAFYERQLQNKSVRLASYKHEDYSINEDLKQFDVVMKELQQELEQAPKGSEEEIIQALIQNYQAKLFVLDRVLQQLQSLNNQSKNNNDGTIQL